MLYNFIHGLVIGGAVLVRSLEWPSEWSAAERTASHAADKRLWHAVRHPAAGLCAASCEFPFDQAHSVSARLILSIMKLYVWHTVLCLRTRPSWCASPCCWGWPTVTSIWWRQQLSGLWESMFCSLVWERWGHWPLSNTRGSFTGCDEFIYFTFCFSGCDVCGRRSKQHPSCAGWSFS